MKAEASNGLGFLYCLFYTAQMVYSWRCLSSPHTLKTKV